ncbi:unnamed protein product [Phytophthora fragariaefolia]|uniref:Unnamed protein product n=1 Tax=Phytophthora fragariaefolia TaxID=1490495 RepID=A0A9W6XHF4_9STRA|nr:unnamed protein product [Phytophthora fragariaefolia]
MKAKTHSFTMGWISHPNHSIGRIKSDKICVCVYAHSFVKSSSYHEHISHYRTITMGLEELQPGNTLRAKATAVAAFTKFLKGEEIDDEYVGKCIEADESGKAFVCVMDKFGMHLAVSEGKKGKMLARNTAMNSLTSVTLSPDDPLVELLNARPETTGLLAPAAAPRVDTTPTIYTHVNRVLDRVAPAAGVVTTLTSHSFRRGGAQHANGCDGMTARWSFDRGAWNLTTTNKSFNYIFNTSREDHKIAKVLSGYKPKAEVKLQNLPSFDSQTLESIEGVQRILFATCYKLKTESFNMSKKVLDVLTACVLRYYPLLKNLNPESPAIKRVETCAIHGGCSPREPSYEQKVIDHQAAVIKHLIENSKLQNARMDLLELRMNGDSTPSARKSFIDDEDRSEVSEEAKKKKWRGSATRLHATWFTWYAQELYWQRGAPKQRRSKSKLLVAYMKLFIADGFILDSAAADYRDRVLELGKRAEDAILTYSKTEHGIKSRGSSAILKHLQRLHNAGALDALIARHQRLLQTATIQDPSPGYTQDVLDAVSNFSMGNSDCPIVALRRGMIRGLHEAGWEDRAQRKVVPRRGQLRGARHQEISGEGRQDQDPNGPSDSADCARGSNGDYSASALKAKYGVAFSVRTIQRLAKVDFLDYSKMDRTLPLTKDHKEARLGFAERLSSAAQKQVVWPMITFSDEMKFNLDGPGGFQHYWRDIRRPPRRISRIRMVAASSWCGALFEVARKNGDKTHY